MSDTPRTDEAELSILDIQNGHGPSPYVPAELARQLERELAAANKRAHYEATWHNHYARLQQAAKSDSAGGQAGGSS